MEIARAVRGLWMVTAVLSPLATLPLAGVASATERPVYSGLSVQAIYLNHNDPIMPRPYSGTMTVNGSESALGFAIGYEYLAVDPRVGFLAGLSYMSPTSYPDRRVTSEAGDWTMSDLKTSLVMIDIQGHFFVLKAPPVSVFASFGGIVSMSSCKVSDASFWEWEGDQECTSMNGYAGLGIRCFGVWRFSVSAEYRWVPLSGTYHLIPLGGGWYRQGDEIESSWSHQIVLGAAVNIL